MLDRLRFWVVCRCFCASYKLVNMPIVMNWLGIFHQLYSFCELGEKCELIRFRSNVKVMTSPVWSRKSESNRLIAPVKFCIVTPSPPLDNIRVTVIVWQLRGNIVRTALCWIVWHNVHSPQHTYVSSSYRSTTLGLSHWDPYAVCRGGCLELYYCNMVEWFWWDSSLILTEVRSTQVTAELIPGVIWLLSYQSNIVYFRQKVSWNVNEKS